LGLLIPVALAAGGHWRAFLAAGASVIGLILLSIVLFGSEAWPAFFAQLANVGQIIQQDGPAAHKAQSLFTALHLLGVPVPVAMAAQIMLAASLVGATYIAWRSSLPYDLKAALLAAGSTLISPYLFFYDSTVLLVAQMFLLRHVWSVGESRTDTAGIAIANLLVFTYPFLVLPMITAASFLTLGLIGRRIMMLEPDVRWWQRPAVLPRPS
jgi:arabinofuranan 3-O-arabinosyltransferase